MQKEVVMCRDCKYLQMSLVSDEAQGKCSHIDALPFPRPNDYCSMGEARLDGRRGFTPEQEKQLLEAVYRQRRN